MASVNFTVAWSNDIAALIAQVGLKAPYAIARAIDEVGNKATTQVKRATAIQAGVPVGYVGGVLSTKQAMGKGFGEFVITAKDVTLSLNKFKARQTKAGVSAAPWNTRRIFPHTFFGPNGHVFVRKGKERLPIKKLWGPAIPREMIKDQAEATFYKVTADLLPFALEKWLLRQT